MNIDEEIEERAKELIYAMTRIEQPLTDRQRQFGRALFHFVATRRPQARPDSIPFRVLAAVD